jgi:hypothetical protein
MEIPYGHRVKILKALGLRENNNTSSLTNTLAKSTNLESEDLYDEEKQRKLFQEAVEHFRKGKITEGNYDKFNRDMNSVIYFL